MKNAYKILVKTMKERNYLKDLDVDGRTLIKRFLRKQDAGRGQFLGSCKLSEESFDSVKGEEFIT